MSNEPHMHWRISFWEIGPKGGVKGGRKSTQITGQGSDVAARIAADFRAKGYGAEVSPAYRSSLYEGRLK